MSEPVDEALALEAESHPELQEARAMLEELYELAHELDPEGTRSYAQLRDSSKMFRKLTTSLQHTIEMGGAPATAAHLLEAIVENIIDYHSAHEFARAMTDPRHLVSGSTEFELYTHLMAGLRENMKQDMPEAA